MNPVEYYHFVLTSTPEEDYLSIHMHCNDETKRRIARSIGCHFVPSVADAGSFGPTNLDIESTADDPPPFAPKVLPQVQFNGPYGSVTRNVVESDIAVGIGAGSGAIAFASVLKSVWYHMNSPSPIKHGEKDLLHLDIPRPFIL